MAKLNWYGDTDYAFTEDGVDEAKSYYTQKDGYELRVYPTSLYNKDSKGFEYQIRNDKEKIDYDSLFESSNGKDHAESVEKAEDWAENTLKNFIKERAR